MVRAGILRHRVVIEAKADGTDDWGQPVEVWQPVVANLPAEVRDIRGREFWQQQQLPVGEVTTRVRLRYRTDITRQMRVRYGETVYEIEAVLDPDGRRRELHVMCREVS